MEQNFKDNHMVMEILLQNNLWIYIKQKNMKRFCSSERTQLEGG